jgi:hypothetical protein
MYSMEGFPTMISGLIVQVNRMIITIYFSNMEAPTADRHSFTINSLYEINLGNAEDTNSSVYLLQKMMKYFRLYHDPQYII